MTEKIIGIIDETTTPPKLISLQKVSSKANVGLNLSRGMLGENVLGFLMDAISVAVHNQEKLEKLEDLLVSERPFTAIMMTLGLDVSEDVDPELWDELDATEAARIDAAGTADGLDKRFIKTALEKKRGTKIKEAKKEDRDRLLKIDRKTDDVRVRKSG